jgi:hypothetical protein
MPNNLLVAVVGHRNSGKSKTWYDLFGYEVITGKRCRSLSLSSSESVDVFLINGSPQERGRDVEDILQSERPRIVLCSLQYVEGVLATFDFFFRNDYSAFVQWLNPGHRDDARYADNLQLIPHLLAEPTCISMRDGKAPTESRVQELKEYIGGWARPRRLVHEAIEARAASNIFA